MSYRASPLKMCAILRCDDMIMREDRCTAKDAPIKCRSKQLRYEQEYVRLSKQILSNPTASVAAKKLALAYPLLVVGAAVWHATSPRYQCVGLNPNVEMVRQVLSMPVAQIDSYDGQKFEQECDAIYDGCLAITHKYTGKRAWA